MARETLHKRLEPGTLVRVNRSNDYGIVLRVKINWGPDRNVIDDPFCYEVLVKGEKVSAYGGGLTVIGDS